MGKKDYGPMSMYLLNHSRPAAGYLPTVMERDPAVGFGNRKVPLINKRNLSVGQGNKRDKNLDFEKSRRAI